MAVHERVDDTGCMEILGAHEEYIEETLAKVKLVTSQESKKEQEKTAIGEFISLK